MRTIYLLTSLSLLLYVACRSGKANPITTDLPLKEITAVNTFDFKKDVQPIFEQHCSPCHFTGGKMYERMPFDKGETIIQHQAGILRRIKDVKEQEVIKNFIAGNK